MNDETTPAATTTGGGSLLRELLEIAVIALALYFVINLTIQTVHVYGPSMLLTLQEDDYLISSKVDYHLHAPERGDIVVLVDPRGVPQDLIKRVVGLPGERLDIRDGVVYINSHVLHEPYLRRDQAWTNNANWPPPGQSDVIPPGEFFLMGDNRNVSLDSRSFGPVPRAEIQSKAYLRILPFNRFGLILSQPTPDR